MRQIKIVMLGAPGSGKGAYSSRIAPKIGVPHIVTGDIFRAALKSGSELGKKVEGFMKAGNLVPDDITIEIVRERLKQADAQQGFVFDGYPRTIPQSEELDKITKIDIVVNLVVPESIIIQRVSSRRTCKNCSAIYNVLFLKPTKEGVCDKCGGELIVREDEKPDVIKHRLEVYNKQTAPLIDYYRNKGLLVDVECNDLNVPPEIMVDKIMEILEKKFG